MQLWHFESRCKCTTVGPTGRSASDSGLLVGGVVANTQHFFQGRDTRNCFCHTIFQQGPHAVEPRLTADRLSRFSIEGHLPDRAIHAKQLEDSLAPAVAGVIAIRAPTTSHETAAVGLLGGQARSADFMARRLVALLAFGADKTYQALSHDGNNAGSDEEWRHADILQSCDSARRIVRM